MSWRVGLTLGAAREQVRVARRLDDLPEVATAFGDGRISYSKARAITRVAEPDDGIDWVELARHSSAAQLEQVVRGVRRAQANEAAELDPEAAAWSLRTRVRYDEAGNFTLTISGPAQYLPVVQAGIEAKKAELQRQRDAEQAEHAATAVPEQDGAEAPDVSAETCEPSQDDVEPAPPADDSVDLDEQAPGWPEGTTRRDVQSAADAFFTAVQQWREPEQDCVDSPAQLPASKASEPAVSDVSAETSGAATVTDAEALLALAQGALAAEQQAHPAIARRRRPQLIARIDPLSGWGRLADGELLPPTSLAR